ncbi:hypothetical protein C1H46_022364 [Malus baccata]|uniref:Uncharacterized protein n=1 Tax=Malus baccata TaxID=106549 RepID=A0A540M0H3_MALBA|nr:hypothetical protein C1H46_022364 [Malus baccata]
MLKRLQSLLGLKRVPIVVGTYNDLILCSADWYYQNDYYICNPYTMQRVAFSPPLPNASKLCEQESSATILTIGKMIRMDILCSLMGSIGAKL